MLLRLAARARSKRESFSLEKRVFPPS